MIQCPYAYFHCLDAQAKGVKVNPDSWMCRENNCAAWGIIDYKNITPEEKSWHKAKFEPVYGCKLCHKQLPTYSYPYAGYAYIDSCEDDSLLKAKET